MTRRIAVARDGEELYVRKMPDAPSFKATEDSGAPSSCYHQELASISGVAGCHNKLSAMIPDVEIQQDHFHASVLQDLQDFVGRAAVAGNCKIRFRRQKTA
jgi:hypothetical protein